MDENAKTIVTVGGAVGGTLWKLREPIGGLWRRILAKLLGRRQRIAITGMAGVGKSVLLDYLTNEARSAEYEAPDAASINVERGDLKVEDLRLVASVIPGQRGITRREDALESLIEEHRVDGVVHLVANGLATVRQPEVKRAYAERGITTIDRLREVQSIEEVEEFREVVAAVRRGYRKGRQPRWMVIAFSKLDLYTTTREAVRAWYEREPDSPFVQARGELLSAVGSDARFQLVTRPLAVRLEDFSWAEETARTSMEEAMRDRLLRELLETTEQLAQESEP